MRFCILLLLASFVVSASPTLLDQGYRAMYNLDFQTAHRDFGTWQKLHPDDPMGPVSDAAAVLFSEFARMHVLESEFFTKDSSFESHNSHPHADSVARQRFENDLIKTRRLAQTILPNLPNDQNALLASVLGQGLHADYLALIEQRNLAALTEMKQSRTMAERLISQHPNCYDANLAVGIENYLLSLKPAPIRWVLRLSGAETNKESGVEQLRITAEKGHYLLPYARLLLAVADLRDGNRSGASAKLSWLAANFPGNPLYRAELSKLK
ncbi:MAG TPA: hypothetical protein VLJ11_13060 [Bryobacteraceae bacterium]|nr:hypothetical protein [Bryobacteraceae bacterium]